MQEPLSQLAAHVARLEDWAGGVGPGQCVPSAHIGSIAAGEIVHNSRLSPEAELVRRHYNDTLAIEMESAGVAQAGHLNGSPVAIVRGISDRADGTKTSDADGTWQPRAAANAAAFATRLARELINEREQQPMHHRSKPDSGNVTKIRADGSTVGIQGKNITNSSVTIGTTPAASTTPDLAAELAGVRDELARARSTGTLDSSIYEAAQDELDLAGKALEEDTAEGRGRFVLALKRLRGLIAESAEVAAKVAALITAVSSL